MLQKECCRLKKILCVVITDLFSMWIYDRRMANVKATWWLTVLLRPTIIYLLKALCLWGSSVACVAVHCLDLYVRAISVKVC